MGRTNTMSCVQLLFMLVSSGEHIYYVLNNLYQYICLFVPDEYVGLNVEWLHKELLSHQIIHNIMTPTTYNSYLRQSVYLEKKIWLDPTALQPLAH